MSMEGEILQRLRDVEKRLELIEGRLGPESTSTSPKTPFGMQNITWEKDKTCLTFVMNIQSVRPIDWIVFFPSDDEEDEKEE